MTSKVVIKASIGRQKLTANTPANEAAYLGSVKDQMNSIMQNFISFAEQIGEQSATIVKTALQPTYDKSQVYVPVDTGALKESGFLEVDDADQRVYMGYGYGGEPNYTVFVHENLDAAHAAPTRAKFLQGPLEEDSDDIMTRIFLGFQRFAGTS